MQTPKARNSSSEVPQKISPRAVSSDVPQKISARAVSSEVAQKISPRAVRQLKTTGLESDSVSSSNLASSTPKNKSPKVGERKSPRSPVSELRKKHPSRVAELETQISELQEDLKKVKDQLSLSESLKKQAQQDAEESKKQLLATSSKLEESQQLLAQSASEEAHVIELQRIAQERDGAWQCQLKAIQKQHSVESAAMASAMNEIEQLKVQLTMVAESEATHIKQAESAYVEINNLKENLSETLLLVEDMKNQLRDCKESEARAQAVIGETLLQLETAKKTVETLRSNGIKDMEAHEAIALKLEQSRACTNLLEGLVEKLKADTGNALNNDSQNLLVVQTLKCETRDNENIVKSIESELTSVKSEVGQLRSALETAEIRYHEEQVRSTVQTRSAYEMVEHIKSTSSLRKAELELELKESKAYIEELKANLMDKETELQGICEENEVLNMRLEKTLSGHREHQMEKELKKSKEDVEILKANLIDKETELQTVSEENELLKLEIKKKEINGGNLSDEVVAELEAARAAEREALMKLGYVMEEADKNNRRAGRVAEQLESAQAENSEMEADLRRLKVQSDQWRKAAEAAAAMLSTGNNGKIMERTGSMDSHYSPMTGKISSPYSEDMDDDFLKKKNGNMLKRIGVLWKKPQK